MVEERTVQEGELEELVQDLAVARAEEAFARGRVYELEGLIAETDLGQQLQRAKQWLTEVTKVTNQIDGRLRQEVEGTWTPEVGRWPHPAVEIKLVEQVAYDEAEALEYARVHLPQTVRLHKPSFEKVAKIIDVPGTAVAKVPKAYIKRDLTAYLPVDPEEEETIPLTNDQALWLQEALQGVTVAEAVETLFPQLAGRQWELKGTSYVLVYPEAEPVEEVEVDEHAPIPF